MHMRHLSSSLWVYGIGRGIDWMIFYLVTAHLSVLRAPPLSLLVSVYYFASRSINLSPPSRSQPMTQEYCFVRISEACQWSRGWGGKQRELPVNISGRGNMSGKNVWINLSLNCYKVQCISNQYINFIWTKDMPEHTHYDKCIMTSFKNAEDHFQSQQFRYITRLAVSMAPGGSLYGWRVGM